MRSSAWDRRIARAEELARMFPAAAELLKFYVEIARFQKGVYNALVVHKRADLDTTLLIPYFIPLVSLVGRIGPKPLAQAAEELSGHKDALQELLITWQDLDAGAEVYGFFAHALLQPYMEASASVSEIPQGGSRSRCPFCGQKPVVGVLREEGDGGKRSLICSLCSTEWEFRRLVCPECGEESPDKLPVCTAGEFEHVRIEACDNCHTYIKSVDLTRNGLAAPVVDELATVPLNLWAEEHGYRKSQLNLLSM